MFKKLAIPFLSLTLVALGACSSNSSSGGTGGAGTGGAGTGGATGTGGAGTGTGGTGTGGTATGTGGEATDAPVDMSTTETGTDTGTDTGADTMTEAGGDTTAGDICEAYVAGSGMLAGISAADFCMKYSTVCTFGGSMRFANMGACVTSYDAAATSAKTCRAGHLCNAAMAGGATVHCPHAMGDGTVCQ
jgi:hypothetical protein